MIYILNLKIINSHGHSAFLNRTSTFRSAIDISFIYEFEIRVKDRLKIEVKPNYSYGKLVFIIIGNVKP